MIKMSNPLTKNQILVSQLRHGEPNKYIICKEYVLGLTPIHFKIDKEDLWLLKCRRFGVHQKINDKGEGYLRCYIEGNRYFLHNLIMSNFDENIIVDHINGDVTDNRKCNLRLCSKHENSMNRKPNKGKNLPKGVRYYKANTHNPYVAFIYINKKEKNLGAFKTVEEALQVRLEAEKKYYGEFRRKEVK